MHKGLKYKEEYNKSCDKCESRNSLPNGYPCYKCTRNPDGHVEPSYDMWGPWEFYSNSGGCPANGGQ